MNIIPISGFQIPRAMNNPQRIVEAGGKPAGLIGSIPSQDTSQTQTEAGSFKSFFEDAINEVERLNTVKEQDTYDLALGKIDDLGTMAVNAEKAETSLKMMVEVRNKLLDAYNEIMRINI